jgi:hypothetical protein
MAYLAGVRYNEVMFIVGILGWWYTTGWKQRAIMLKERLRGTVDYFSIDLLLKTLFAPFRQISAGKVSGSLNVQLRALFDRLLSRIIGAVVRLMMIVIGTVVIIFHSALGMVWLLAWGIIPFLPFLCLYFFMAGWQPWTL